MENVVKDLNDFLSDLNIFYRKLQNYHWNVRGKDFFVLHSKLEEYYDEVNKQIDEIAEHILMLGEQPLGTMQDYLNNTCIVEAKNEKIEEKAIFENIINDLGTLLNKVTNINVITPVIEFLELVNMRVLIRNTSDKATKK